MPHSKRQSVNREIQRRKANFTLTKNEVNGLQKAAEDRDCFLRATKGDFRCAERGMRILQECMYVDHTGDMGNDYCGVVLASVSKRIRKIKAKYGKDITSRVLREYSHTYNL